MNEKWCNRCEQTLPVDSFTKNSAKSSGLQPYCKDCMKKYRKEHYNNNKQAHFVRNLVAEAKLRQQVLEIKNASSCADCDISYPNEPWLLEFDHLPEFGKSKNISMLVKYGSWKRLKEEIDKCELVCLICHRRRTASRGGWVDNRLAHLL